MRALLAQALLAWCCTASAPAAAAQAPAPGRTIIDLQTFRQSSSIGLAAGGSATLIDLNPAIGAWYVLNLQSGGGTARSFHLENMDAEAPRLYADGLLLGQGATPCPLWPGGRGRALDDARLTGLPYAPLCGGHLYLRNAAVGTYTQLERVTNFLRDRVWGGEVIIDFVRDRFYQDAFLEPATPVSSPGPAAVAAPAPPAARLAPDAEVTVAAADLGIDLGKDVSGLELGRWYPVHAMPGVYLSAVQARAVEPEVPERLRGRIDLDEVEGAALDYLVAFDLTRFDLRFALGTDHPRLGWSERVLDEVRVPGLAGPDGIDNDAPLARTGMVAPALIRRVAATFTGGFKREHGAFHYGELANVSHGSHYGFIEEGVVFSTLQPGLSTLFVLADGSVGMKTWTAADNDLLPQLRYARQNGVALVEQDRDSATPQPGPLVTQWGPGNWSGSKDEQFRTLRAGVCLSGAAPGFLVYGYFSAATPRAMARVFQAYGCRYAMHLDMNALEHTYLALYTRSGGRLLVQHLIEGMAEVDKKGGGQPAPRFLGFPDDRDFFYLLRRGEGP